MVLRVSDLNPRTKSKLDHKKIIELTDGFYPIISAVDDGISLLISSGRLKRNQKIIICYAKIVNRVSGHPLEIYDKIVLGITYNCTKRAYIWVKLGECKDSSPFSIILKSIRLENQVGGINVRITRVYEPQIYKKYSCDGFTYRKFVQGGIEEFLQQSTVLNDLKDSNCKGIFYLQ